MTKLGICAGLEMKKANCRKAKYYDIDNVHPQFKLFKEKVQDKIR